LTEIPEHLLKRSRERRSAMGGGDDASAAGGGASQSSETSPVAAQAATASSKAPAMPSHPAPESTPAVPPPSPMVEAHRRRRKIPFWAMPVLAALPLWAYVYQGTLSPPPVGEGPEALGEELFSSAGCAGCHGAGGGGGVGPGFTGGAIYETFPEFVQHLQWVRLGSAGWQEQVGPTYGANDKPVNGGMPGFGEDQLTDADLVYVVLHERLLGGENPNEEDMLQLEELALLMFENEGMTLDEALAEIGVDAAAPEGGSGADLGEPPAANAPEEDDTPGSGGNEGPGTNAEVGEGAGGSDQTGDGESNSGTSDSSTSGSETPPQSAGGDSTAP
jgi:mono/diheme cytochrome c family protein